MIVFLTVLAILIGVVLFFMIGDGDIEHDDAMYHFKKIGQIGRPLGNLDDIDTAELFTMAQKVKAQKTAAVKSLTDAVIEGREGTRSREKIRIHNKTLSQLNRELKKRGSETP